MSDLEFGLYYMSGALIWALIAFILKKKGYLDMVENIDVGFKVISGAIIFGLIFKLLIMLNG